MPAGKGTYGKKVGRPSKKGKAPFKKYGKKKFQKLATKGRKRRSKT